MSNDNNINTLGNWLLAIAVIFILCVGGIFLGVLNIEFWTLKEKYEYGTKALTAIGTVFGGIAVFINAFFAAKRAAAMEATAKAANESAKAANKNAEVAEDKQITERFAKAIEQLASEKIAVRLGAIYTLERIAKDSEKDQWTIMEVLTAFVREYAPIEKEEKSQNKKSLILIDEFLNTQNKKEIEELPKPRLDLQECLTVIVRRKHPDKPGNRLDLSNINISKAKFPKKAKLQGTNFRGADLRGVDLKEADLRGADLIKADLRGAYLTEADLRGANLEAANLAGANFAEADLREANLMEADLRGAYLIEADLRGAYLTEADLRGIDLTKANLTGVNRFRVNLTEAQITRAIMPDGSIHD